MVTKAHIRSLINQRRQAEAPAKLITASQLISEAVIALPEFSQCDWVYAYVDFNHEVATKAIIEAAWQQNKRVAVPKVSGEEMHFHEITSFTDLKPGYFGIPEPENGPPVFIEEALMIVPGVAFDRVRHRIGYGGGFYDRYLSRHVDHITVAVAFDFQIVDEAPCEELDIIPQMLITESNRY